MSLRAVDRYDVARQDDVIRDNLASFIGTLLLVAIPTAIVYWRNKGKLSARKSYLKGMLYVFRVLGWGFIIWGVLFLPLFITDLFGLINWGYPWWSIAFSAFLIGFGYGLQRLMRFILNDPDWNNMFASKDE